MFRQAIGALAILGATLNVNAAVVGFDNGESSSYLSYVQSDNPVADGWSPGDWFGWGAYGAWPQGTPPGVPWGIADDSVVDISRNGGAPPFSGDSQGIIDSTTASTDQFFGVIDTANSSNTDNAATATWTFDITGFSNLSVSADFAAMGDFEAATDEFRFSYAIDGGVFQSLFDFVVDEAVSETYTMESGLTPSLDDPLKLGTILLNDVLTTFTAGITGEGSVLTILFFASTDGDNEAFVFDNLTVTGDAAVPVPATLALLGLGLAGIGFQRNKKAKAA